MAKPKVNIIVSMHGGTIQNVFFDNDEVEVGQVVFTEGEKYGDDEREEVVVGDGPLEGEIVYSVHLPEVGGPELFAPVLKAADEYAADESAADASIPLGDEQES